MKLSAIYEVRDGYLYMKVTGEFSPSAARGIFSEWTETARRHGLDRILSDVTLVKGLDAEQPSIMLRFDTSAFVAKSLPRDFSLAVLETPEQLSKDRFFENVMVNRGAIVKVTSSLNEALE